MKMTIAHLADAIELPGLAKEKLLQFAEGVTEEGYQKWKLLFQTEEKEFFDRINEVEDMALLLLYLYMRMAAELYPVFRERNITEQIYRDTCYDITIWCQKCMERYHKIGIIEEEWLAGFLRLQIFRLGRLQFEPEGELLHVHIPEGPSLMWEDCEKSFAQARAFFGPGYTYFDCHSWLLSTKLRELLSEDSNIIRFQQHFDILEVTYPFRQAEERVFGYISRDKTEYPEGTSLQRKLKAYVMGGADIGIGYGRIPYRAAPVRTKQEEGLCQGYRKD